MGPSAAGYATGGTNDYTANSNRDFRYADDGTVLERQSKMNDIQRIFANIYADKRKKLGESFLAALYNLRLAEGYLSQEEKKRLANVVWLFFQFPAD